jgi:hypothetical protein
MPVKPTIEHTLRSNLPHIRQSDSPKATRLSIATYEKMLMRASKVKNLGSIILKKIKIPTRINQTIYSIINLLTWPRKLGRNPFK